MADKNITLRIDEDVHKKIKLEATNQGVTIKDYIMKLVLKDLESKKK